MVGFTDWGTWLACWFLESVFPFWCALCACIRGFFPLCFLFYDFFLVGPAFVPHCFSIFCHDHPRPVGVGDCIYLGGVYVSGSCFPLVPGGSGVILSSFGSGCEFGRSMRVSVQQRGFFHGYEKVVFYRF
ncbi:uncharacterized protein BO80DRAFT_40411 [Aspergillus ibericus CBS 121593]|uniref:Uncharacterized protein n=1 Tax=Aspergillus ibericus CBS 121593 TaxID=1448316 RepID=A0A395H302_9EURO|nr:hypothetical protein BO80DRAFT_40411 [Aspergillus ibericus CBS 121593]RAL02136.1 hypothetical protein BO80DRAFT_40411 [Aspergillus ibericus CBS 121593]